MAAVEREQISTWPAAASTAVAPLITAPAQPAEVIVDFPVAKYLQVNGAVVALVSPDAVRLPNALVCHELPPVADGDHVRPHGNGGWVMVGDGCIQLGRARVTVGRWWDPVPRLPAVADPSALARAVDSMRSRLPGWPEPGEPAVEQLTTGRETLISALAREATSEEAADQLVGLGAGLTPAGDDLLAGAVAGLVIFGRAMDNREALDLAKHLAAAVDERAARTTVLAADLARHAVTGAVAEPVAAVCRALAGRDPLEPVLDRLLAVGHTSGRDLAEGLLVGTTAAITC